jgi:hypothetical protein
MKLRTSKKSPSHHHHLKAVVDLMSSSCLPELHLKKLITNIENGVSIVNLISSLVNKIYRFVMMVY